MSSTAKPKVWERGGPSPNPAGRKPGTHNRGTTSSLDRAAKQALRLLMRKTKEGDVQAADALLKYCKSHVFN
jgi:hypothetical protein